MRCVLAAMFKAVRARLGKYRYEGIPSSVSYIGCSDIPLFLIAGRLESLLDT